MIRGQMKKVLRIVLSINIIILFQGCSSLNYSEETYIPTIIILNQYDKPMTATISSSELYPSTTTIKIPPFSNYTLEFPYDIFTLVNLDFKGAYFSNFNRQYVSVNKYKQPDKVIPQANYGWVEIINHLDKKLYYEAFGKEGNYLYEIRDFNLFSFSSQYKTFQAIEINNYFNQIFNTTVAIRVESDTLDFISYTDSLGGEKFIIGDKVSVKPGETVSVEIYKLDDN